MNKSELIEKLIGRQEIDPTCSHRIVSHFFNHIKTALQEGDKVEIRGFGSFHLKEYGGYTGRNPKTGKTVEVLPKKLPIFKVGKDLKERVNH